MHVFQRIFRFFLGYWSQGTPQDRPQEDNNVREYALENESDEDTQLLKEQEVKYQEWLSRLETEPFYPNKLFLRNVTPGLSKELVMNYLEIVTGQEATETLYCDRPGDVLVTFKTEVDFVKVKEKCETKLLNERQLEVWRVPVSNSILVDNLSPSTDPDHVFCYFETPRAKGGTVLEVHPVKGRQKCVVYFEDASVVDDVLKVTHRLGGRELQVSLYLECLGPSGGKREPYVFVSPAPIEMTDEDDLKIAFLRHSAEMLQMFNAYLSEIHANATVVGNVLTVSCTLTGSMHRVDLLVEKWRDDVNKQLQDCFNLIRLQRLEVQPEIWWDVRNAINESELNTDDLVLPLAEECAFAVLYKSCDAGDTFARIQEIANVKQKESESRTPKVYGAKTLKKYQLDLLRLSTFFADTQSHHRDLTVDIRLKKGEVVFHGPLMVVREAQLKMLDVLPSVSSTVVTNIPDDLVSLLDTEEAREAVNNRLKQARLAATWECCGNGIIVYCLHQTALLQAVSLIQTSFKSERILLDEVSSNLQTTSEWKDTVENLLKQHCGLLKISTNLNTIFLTAFSDLMPIVKENVRKFVSESSIYSADFHLSSSRLKFVTLFWEDKLSRIAEKFQGHKINLTLQSDGVLVRGTNQGIDLVRMELTTLSEQIVCTEQLITRKETIKCLTTLWNYNELEAIACNSKCVLSHHPENVSVQMITKNFPAEGPRVHAVQGDITQLTVDVIVNAANELMDHAGGLAGHIVLKGGKEIQKECHRILKTRGKLSEGEVLVSGPGKLPCKSIIHAVGPRYKGGNKGEEGCLRTTVLECLKTASSIGYSSIAIPAISSGIFGYPVKEATRVIVQAVKLFFETNRDSSIQDVQLADILIDTVQEFEKALEATYCNCTPITKQATSKVESLATSLPRTSQTSKMMFLGKEPTSSREPHLNQPHGRQHVTTSVNIADDAFHYFTEGAVQNVKQETTATTAYMLDQRVPGLDFGGIHVTIKQGDITEEHVDAIVNSSNSKLDLSQGAVSCKLIAKCGSILQCACKEKISEMAQRKLVTTPAFSLRCKHIVHIDTSHYVNNDLLTTAYMDIMKEADNLGLNSIALPAVGTGNLSISPSKSARAMGEALVAQSRIRKTLTAVTVVLFDAAMRSKFTVKLREIAAAEGFAQSTSSGRSDVFKRLYLPENEKVEEWTTRSKNSPLPTVLKLYIFAASQDRRADFSKALDSLVTSKFVEQEIKDFDTLSREKVEELCRKYDLELRQRDAGASVKGMVDDIQMLKEEISSMIKKAERQQQEIMIANLVQWYFFEVTTTGIKRIPYEKRENLLMENAYQGNKDTVELTDSEGTVYVVNFKDMTDSVKMCPTDSVQIMRKEIITDSANNASLLPETWDPLSNEESVKRVTLVNGSPEYETVKNTMSQTAKSAFTIKSVERIQNPELYKQYLAKKTQMNKQNNGMQDERTLWHGTSSDAIDNINLYGFNRSFCGKNATHYGQGVYFAVNSSYSMSDTYSVRDQSGRKYMYLCKVLVGYPTVGTSGMKVLPPRQGKIRYDSATDNNSSKYVRHL